MFALFGFNLFELILICAIGIPAVALCVGAVIVIAYLLQFKEQRDLQKLDTELNDKAKEV
jgi:hypothetical protein